MNLYLDLFLTFAQIGACTFGGGLAMLPILQREVVGKKGWCTDEELADYYAIGQCTPGIIAVNTATFVGHKQKGNLGGIVATLGVVFPSVVIIVLIAAFLRNFAHISAVAHAAVAVYVGVLLLSLFSSELAALLPAVGFLFSPVTYVILAGACGLLISAAGRRKG